MANISGFNPTWDAFESNISQIENNRGSEEIIWKYSGDISEDHLQETSTVVRYMKWIC